MAKKAVLVGCNYPGTASALRGCVYDAFELWKILVRRFGFQSEDVELLVDQAEDLEEFLEGLEYVQLPTGAAIRAALEKMVCEARPGDIFFFAFSGHGGRNEVDDAQEIDDTGFDECIYPTDFDLIDDDYFRELLSTLPSGTTFTMISDSCQSGGLIDQAKEQIGNSFQQLPLETALAEPADDVEERGLKRKDLSAEVVAQILREVYGRDDIDARNVGTKAREIFGRAAASSSTKEKKKTKKEKKKKQAKKNKKKKSASGSSSSSRDSSSSDSSDDDNNNNNNDDDELDDDEDEIAAASTTLIRGSDVDDENGGGGLQAAILVSGCQSHQTSQDVGTLNPPQGALTHAVVTLLKMLEPDEPITNGQLVTRVRRYLASQNYTQQPGLYCPDDKVDAPFVCQPVAAAAE